MKIVRKNTIYNVLERFSKEDTEVIAMLVGDSFNVGDNKLIQHERNKNLIITLIQLLNTLKMILMKSNF